LLARQQKFGTQASFLKCSFIPNDVLEGMPVQDCTQEELEDLRAQLDPVVWARKELNITLRPYQELMIKCTAQRRMSRTGRRVGKTISMGIHCLHYAYTHEKKKILIIAPYEIQIKEIFRLFDEWVEESANVKSSVSRRINNPYTLELRNGSRILGLTAGSKSGMGAASVRGQEADVIYLDEADYLAREDVNAILVLLQKTNEASEDDKFLWASSTPTGKHEFFYDWSQNSRFKEFHYSSMINPNWNEDMSREFREQFGTSTAWDHEVLAEWGEEMEGVYQKAYLERAKALAGLFLGQDGVWDYKAAVPLDGCMYTIGVDWNSSKNGVQIAIIEYNPKLVSHEDIRAGIKGRFRVATRVAIDAKEFTQSKAVAKIIELNGVWQPKYIYVDQGFGSTQIEELRRFGHANPDSGMLNKLKAIDFGSSQEIRDPVTKQIVKKAMKPFMVNNSVSFYEKNLVLLNRTDKEYEKQLSDYSVEKRSREGRPVYSTGNDHVLDAVNLALLAYTMEFTDLGKPIYATEMRIAGPMGEPASQASDGIVRIIDREKTNSGIRPRDIQKDERAFFKTTRLWERGKYRTAKHNRPIKRDI
jgi:replicative DNA helicase